MGNTLFPDLAWLIGGISVASIPVAIGVAILQYRLYDIDLLINRTLVYGALTATLAVVYVGSVVFLQSVLRAISGQDSQGADPQKIISWFVMRWQLEVTLQEVRRHLGFETQRHWSDSATLG